MGRIKTKKIKRMTREVFKNHEESLTNDYEENKKVINTKYTVPSKKLRNVIAGYCTRLNKAKED